jgi:predicted nucleotidyltransferase
LFGSVARGEADILSDVDIVVHTTPVFVALSLSSDPSPFLGITALWLGVSLRGY